MELYIVRSKWQSEGKDQVTFMATDSQQEAIDYAADEASEPDTEVQIKTVNVTFNND